MLVGRWRIFFDHRIDVCIQRLDNLSVRGVGQTTTFVEMGLPAENAGTIGGCILVGIHVVSGRRIVGNRRWVSGRATRVGFMKVRVGSQVSLVLKYRAALRDKAVVDTGS